MHYSANAFAIPNSQTIQALDTNIPVGSAQELSPLDAAKANLLYKCSKFVLGSFFLAVKLILYFYQVIYPRGCLS